MKEAIMKKIELTQGKFALVDNEWFDYLNQYNWHAINTHYDDIHWYAGRRQMYKTLFMHNIIMNPPIGFEVDHKNGIGLDNQCFNLRIVLHQQNQMNQRKRQGTSSQYKGVSWYKKQSLWRAYITVSSIHITLGVFVNEKDAARAYNAAALKYFGEFANLNIIEDD